MRLRLETAGSLMRAPSSKTVVTAARDVFRRLPMETAIALKTSSNSRRSTIKWTVATILTPLAGSMLCANLYVVFWYAAKAAAGAPHNGSPPLEVIQRGVMLTSGVGLWLTVGLWWWLNRRQDSFATLFGTRTRTWMKEIGLGLGIGIGWVAIYGLIGWPPFSAMFRLDSAKLLSVPASISAGFCEEFLFRGFLVLLLARAGKSIRTQVLWSSLAFGLAHVLWGPVGMLFTLVLGASFAVVTLWRGNVWAAVVAHTFLDLCIEPGLFEKALALQRSLN